MSQISQVLDLSVKNLVGIGINSGLIIAGTKFLTPRLAKLFNITSTTGTGAMLVQLLAVAISLWIGQIISAAVTSRL